MTPKEDEMRGAPLQTKEEAESGFEAEMQAALEADGEKLRQLTGRDHGPEFVPEQWFVCDSCGGTGTISRRITVYEHGCGFPHDDTAEDECESCGGVGGWIVDAEPNHE